MTYLTPSPIYSPARSARSHSEYSRSSKNSLYLLDEGGPKKEDEGRYKWLTLGLCVLTTSFTSILLGYDVGIMSAALPLMESSLKLGSYQMGIIAGSLNFIAGVGAIPFGKLADKFGRKITLIVACVVFSLGTGMMALSTSFSMLLFSRAIMGSGVGATFVIAPVYLSELVPAEVRGALVCCFDIFINVGILLGFIGGYLIDTELDSGADSKWRIMIGLGSIPALFIAMATHLLPESPRWLISQGRKAEAEASLSRIVINMRIVNEEVESMIAVFDSETVGSYAKVLNPQNKSMRLALHVTLGLAILQQVTGSEAAIVYTPFILRNAGLKSTRDQLLWVLPVGFAKLLGELFSVPNVDRLGRRPLLLLGSFLQFTCLSFLSVGFESAWDWRWLITLISLFMFTFELGAPIAWLMPSELYPSETRGRAQSISVSLNRCMSGVVVLVFPPILGGMGPGGLFALFASLALASCVWYYLVVPETAGLTLEEITTLLREESYGHLSDASNYPRQIKRRGGKRRGTALLHGGQRQPGYGTIGWMTAREQSDKKNELPQETAPSASTADRDSDTGGDSIDALKYSSVECVQDERPDPDSLKL
eukprot:CAMPEP_0184482572 /NCGR_PEP_ID=MMETSP0113_2-20130426/4138_1 /TAXON_ID=91329 /ORGANISM="Norrisiella sphaerica, Strain BC52" /LENGTH=594 /DNA_ID=CAMNT_0026862387 /DNA_START=90 /DNA_END=1874 /DNA_ORIENTATION=+